jgi:hypothetical protein
VVRLPGRARQLTPAFGSLTIGEITIEQVERRLGLEKAEVGGRCESVRLCGLGWILWIIAGRARRDIGWFQRAQALLGTGL